MHPATASRFASQLHLATILSPTAVAEERANSPQNPDLPPWLLQQSLPDAVIRQFESARNRPPVPNLFVYAMPCGAMLALAVLQVGTVQLRTAIPLVGEDAHAWLNYCVAESRLGWLLDVEETHQAVHISVRYRFLETERLSTLAAESKPSTTDELALNLTEAASMLLPPSSVRSLLPGLAVEEAHVGIVVTEVACTAAMKSLTRALLGPGNFH